MTDSQEGSEVEDQFISVTLAVRLTVQPFDGSKGIWEDVKEILEENYATHRTIDYYACRLFNARQGTREGVANWGSRVDTMVTDLKEAESKGTLGITIEAALEEESNILSGKDLHKPTHSGETVEENRSTCTNCGKWGHGYNNCTLRKGVRERWSREKRINIGQAIGGMRQQGYQNQYHKEDKGQDEDNRNTCFRCGRRGHYARACRAQSGETTGNRNHQVSTQPQGYGRLEIKQGRSEEKPIELKKEGQGPGKRERGRVKQRYEEPREQTGINVEGHLIESCPHECILGKDFLSITRMVIDYGKNGAWVMGELITFHEVSDRKPTVVTVPTRCEKLETPPLALDTFLIETWVLKMMKGCTNIYQVLRETLKLDHLHKDEKVGLLELCEEYNDILQLPGDKLSYTNTIEHRIPTAPNCPLIAMKPYRIPEIHKEEVNKQV
ncbi:hypothetical protein PR048_017980 [Dryococelus australis]|uniref:CCHC-type domain-containing protein n=1 Tax=Dryococelus australis TaxID=614101 RepID=A0ABQ9HB48_9NEOP|nr:hypothetical protein PR048_017980 [Dryococelus australis]